MVKRELLVIKPTRIRILSFFVNEAHDIPEEIDVTINFTTGFNLEKSILGIIIRATIHQKDKVDDPFVSISVDNKYYVEDLKEYHGDKGLDLPVEISRIFVSISYSHTRALLADRLEGTKFKDTFLPVVNTDNLLMKDLDK